MSHLEFSVPARYYSRGCVDWDSPRPASGYNGVRTKLISLSTANTAINCIHVSNSGYRGGVQWQGERGTMDYYRKWFAREHRVTKEHIVPLLSAARKAHLQILRVSANPDRYPQYARISSRARLVQDGWSPPPRPEALSDWQRHMAERKLGKDFGIKHGQDGISPLIDLQPEDWVVAKGWESSTLFNEHGIWNLLFLGFCGAGCLLNLTAGVLAMRGQGYRCFIVEDCSLCIDTPQTRSHNKMREAFFKAMQLYGYCYLINSRDVIKALQTAAATNGGRQ